MEETWLILVEGNLSLNRGGWNPYLLLLLLLHLPYLGLTFFDHCRLMDMEGGLQVYGMGSVVLSRWKLRRELEHSPGLYWLQHCGMCSDIPCRCIWHSFGNPSNLLRTVSTWPRGQWWSPKISWFSGEMRGDLKNAFTIQQSCLTWKEACCRAVD